MAARGIEGGFRFFRVLNETCSTTLRNDPQPDGSVTIAAAQDDA
jgi:hypothetical protein